MAYRSSIPRRLREADRKVERAVERAVHDIEAGAKIRSRVDTGHMRAAWAGRMTGSHTGLVTNGVSYVRYHEYGTRYMSAQPMAVPAAEHVRPGFVRAVRLAYD